QTAVGEADLVLNEGPGQGVVGDREGGLREGLTGRRHSAVADARLTGARPVAAQGEAVGYRAGLEPLHPRCGEAPDAVVEGIVTRPVDGRRAILERELARFGLLPVAGNHQV